MGIESLYRHRYRSFFVVKDCTCTFPSCADLLLSGVKSILDDPTFSLPTVPAASMTKVAKHLSVWIPEHVEETRRFEVELGRLLDCVQNQAKFKRQQMWESYHSVRTSSTYRSAWTGFLLLSGTSYSPAFCQHVGHYVFKKLVELHHPIPEPPLDRESSFEPTYEEECGIRYATGWVVRALTKKLAKSSHPHRSELRLCLLDFLDDDTDKPHESAEWVELIDRGGLFKVSNIAYELFLTMEKALRNIIQSCGQQCIPEDCIKSVTQDDDVQFIWCMISSDWSDACTDVLLEMLASQWIKIRGFSYASAWVEKYKAEQCKTIQKTKGVRKQLMQMRTNTKKMRHDNDSA